MINVGFHKRGILAELFNDQLSKEVPQQRNLLGPFVVREITLIRLLKCINGWQWLGHSGTIPDLIPDPYFTECVKSSSFNECRDGREINRTKKKNDSQVKISVAEVDSPTYVTVFVIGKSGIRTIHEPSISMYEYYPMLRFVSHRIITLTHYCQQQNYFELLISELVKKRN